MESSDIASIIILTTLLILLLVAGISISFFVINRQKERQKAQLIESKLNFEMELRKVEIEVGEQLRGHIARELHDHLGHEITCLRLAFENHKLDYPEMETVFQQLGNHITQASEQLKLLSRSLNKDFINELSLSQAIKLEVERQMKLGFFDIEWRDSYKPQYLNKNQELIAFRIFQEVMNNALKHSKATRITICLTNEPEFLFEVKDDGQGFNIDQTLNSSSASGLRNVLRRAEMAGFHCQIETSKQNGCAYSFTMADKDEIL